jgi:hypothetical protein
MPDYSEKSKFIDRKGRKDLRKGRKGLNIGKDIYFDSGMV